MFRGFSKGFAFQEFWWLKPQWAQSAVLAYATANIAVGWLVARKSPRGYVHLSRGRHLDVVRLAVVLFAAEGLLWGMVALVAFPIYTVFLERQLDPAKALVFAANNVVILGCFALHFKHEQSEVPHLVFLSILAPVLVLSLEHTTYYCAMFKRVNARTAPSLEVLFPWAISQAVLCFAFNTVLSHASAVQDAGLLGFKKALYIIIALLFAQSLATGAWVAFPYHVSYVSLQVFSFMLYFVARLLYVVAFTSLRVDAF